MKNSLIVIVSVIFFIGCSSDNDNDSFLSNDAQVYSFDLKDNKNNSSILNKVNFAINHIDGIIYNPNTLPKNTIIDDLNMNISFNPTYGVDQVRVISPSTSYVWNKKSLIDFSIRPIYLEITAPSGKAKRYLIDLRIN